MSTTLAPPELNASLDLGKGGTGFTGFGGGGDRGGGSPRPFDRYQTLSWVLLIPVFMFFIGLTSALVVRRGLSEDWISIQVPGILYLNTLILLASSVTIEKARRVAAARANHRVRLWLTTGLGACFLVGQLAAWRALAAQGVFLASNPGSSFFYVLTATHGMHLFGGMVALLYLTIRMLRNEFSPPRLSALKATAVYWHFMDALWIYLLLLLTLWR